MKYINVTIPVTGVAYAIIEVEDNATEDEIFNKAVDEILARPVAEQMETYELLRKVLTGNVWHAEAPSEWSMEVQKDDI